MMQCCCGVNEIEAHMWLLDLGRRGEGEGV